MKYIGMFFAFVLIGAGCVSSVPTSPNETSSEETQELATELAPDVADVKDAWNEIVVAAENKDCEAFNKHMTERLNLNQVGCDSAFEIFAAGIPELDWEGSSADGENAVKVMMANGRTLTTFYKNEETQEWEADTIFWK